MIVPGSAQEQRVNLLKALCRWLLQPRYLANITLHDDAARWRRTLLVHSFRAVVYTPQQKLHYAASISKVNEWFAGEH